MTPASSPCGCNLAGPPSFTATSPVRRRGNCAYNLLHLISTNVSSPFTGGSRPPAGMDVSARGKQGVGSPGRGTSLTSKRKSTMATNMYTSLLARNRPGQWVFAPPNGLQLVLRSRLLSFMNRRASKMSVLDPKTAGSMCSCLYGIRSLRPGCRALPPIVTGSATRRIPTGLRESTGSVSCIPLRVGESFFCTHC